MGLLKKATNQQAFAKVGIYGFAGSGKTYTAIEIVKGIAGRINSPNFAFFDTETGSDWFVDKTELDMLQIKTRSFSDLLDVIDECEAGASNILIVDSITHVWRGLIESWKRKRDRNYIEFRDWGEIKEIWGRYTDKFINSRVHIVVCGRAGIIYDQVENSRGKLEPVKAGTKMKAETEFEFEPNLTLEMTLEQDSNKNRIVNSCIVCKDRSDTINGKQFNYPTFNDLKGHFDYINIGGKHTGVNLDRTDDNFIPETTDNWAARQKEREIALDELQNTITKHIPGRSVIETKLKGDLLETTLNTRSWKKLEREGDPVEIKFAKIKIQHLYSLPVDVREEMQLCGIDEDGKTILDADAPVKTMKENFDDYFQGATTEETS